MRTTLTFACLMLYYIIHPVDAPLPGMVWTAYVITFFFSVMYDYAEVAYTHDTAYRQK